MAQSTHIQTYQSVRPYLFAVAYRMTGSAADAEDLVHDAWVRYLDAGAPVVDSLRAYLTTIVSRLSLDHLKSARVRRESYVGPWLPEPLLTSDAIPGPDASYELRESVSMALLTLLERLTPEQRVVYVLRESFDLPYEDIGHHVGKSAAACRQAYRRARSRLAGARPPQQPATGQLEALASRLVQAFESADPARIARLLAEDVTWISDGGPHRLAARKVIRGADRVSRGLAGLAGLVATRSGPGHVFTTVECVNGAPAVLHWEGSILSTVVQFEADDEGIRTIWFSRNLGKLHHLATSIDTSRFVAGP